MNHDVYSDAYIRDILVTHRTIAMVGASPNTSRPSHFAMKYLKAKGFRVIPVNPVQAGQEILGEKVYASRHLIPVVGLIVLVLGSIYVGIATATVSTLAGNPGICRTAFRNPRPISLRSSGS